MAINCDIHSGPVRHQEKTPEKNAIVDWSGTDDRSVLEVVLMIGSMLEVVLMNRVSVRNKQGGAISGGHWVSGTNASEV